MNDDRFDEYLREVARDAYNPPPAPPREEIWARIEEARRYRHRAHRTGGPLGWWRHGFGIAAVLAVGIGIGRAIDRSGEPRVAAGVAESPAGPDAGPAPGGAVTDATAGGAPFRLAAVQHLSRSEALLTSYRATRQAGQTDAEITAWAHDLLTGTRLLLDSPAAEDPRIRSLLQDLELVLAQIAQVPVDRAVEEVDLIDQALSRRDVLARLRTAVPAGPLEARS